MHDEPHQSQPVRTAGVTLKDADLAIVMLHGRGASPDSMLDLAGRLDLDGCAVLVPQAFENRWYPNGFMKAFEANEPDLSSALRVVSGLVERCEDAGISRDRIIVAGFSQGACLASEWVARNPARYAGVVALSGGMIGPDGGILKHEGTLDGTPVVIGCSDVDPWIPLQRVHETRDEFERMGAEVELLIFEGAEHTIRDQEVVHFNQLIETNRSDR